MVFSLAFYPSFLAREHASSSSSSRPYWPSALLLSILHCRVTSERIGRQSCTNCLNARYMATPSIFSCPFLSSNWRTRQFLTMVVEPTFRIRISVSRQRFVTRHAQTTPLLLFLRSREFMQNERRVQSLYFSRRKRNS